MTFCSTLADQYTIQIGSIYTIHLYLTHYPVTESAFLLILFN